MKKEKQKGIYSAPVLKVVSFQVEGGFAGSGQGIPSGLFTTNTQVESWIYDGPNSDDNISNSFGNIF